jgi:hypothetical protein
MNKKQKNIIIRGIVLLILIFLFPLCEKYTSDDNRITTRHYSDRLITNENNDNHHSPTIVYGIRFIVLTDAGGDAGFQIVPSLLFFEAFILTLSVVGLLLVYKEST